MAAVRLLFQPVARSVAWMWRRSISSSESGSKVDLGEATSPDSPAVAMRREIQVVGVDEVAAGQHDGALDDVLQLADVARPAILLHQVQGLGREAANLAARFGVVLVEEVIGQLDDVLGPLAERRDEDLRRRAGGNRGRGGTTPSATAFSRSRLVAAITRTSTLIGWLPPTRSNGCPSSTRRNLAWIDGRISPISSSMSVPWWAARTCRSCARSRR